MSKNLSEFVVEKVIHHLEASDNEFTILKHIFEDQYLRCKLCNVILVPVPINKDKKYQNNWICPCDFCFIGDSYSTYDNYHHNYRSRGLGEPICDEIYCRGCVEKHGYKTFFSRYNIKKRELENYNGDFHEPQEFDRKNIIWKREMSDFINMCKKCNDENSQ